VDRIRPLYLILSGLLVTAAATGLLVQPPDTALLALAGSLTGAGGGLIITPLVAEMSWRSGDSDRGSAFALLSAAMSGGIALGSIGLAPLVATIGYEAAVAATAVGLGVAAVVTIRDSTLAHAPARRVSADELETPELG
jgi:predicted MFS family arabinose efflux permease